MQQTRETKHLIEIEHLKKTYHSGSVSVDAVRNLDLFIMMANL